VPLLLALGLLASAPPSLQANREVPFTTNDSQIIVPATVNGRSLKLIFDTGFSLAVIADTTVDLGKPSGTTTLEDFVGRVQATTVPIKTLKLGDVSIPISGEDAIQQPGVSEFGGGVHVDGLMGFTVIKDSITEINFQNKKFIFHPVGTDLAKRVPDNKRTFLVPMEPAGTRSIILGVKIGGAPLHMALDTGNAFYATVNRDVLERVGAWDPAKEPKFLQESGVASGSVTSWAKKIKDASIFSVPVPESTWDIIDRPAADSILDGTVGFEFLKNFNVTFDFKRRLVWLENWSGRVVDPPIGELGISAAWSKRRKAVMVARVCEGSPAAEAGIQQGDTILNLDDADLNAIPFLKLRHLFMGAVGSKVKLTVAHDGVSRQLTLDRAELVNP
jgi:hypothetical protein